MKILNESFMRAIIVVAFSSVYSRRTNAHDLPNFPSDSIEDKKVERLRLGKEQILIHRPRSVQNMSKKSQSQSLTLSTKGRRKRTKIVQSRKLRKRKKMKKPRQFQVRTDEPTPSPTESPTPAPTRNPTKSPTRNPTRSPTKNPTRSPTKNPTRSPTKDPTLSPSAKPSSSPTVTPSFSPTASPTASPTSCSCPRNPSGSSSSVWNAQIIVDLIGAPDELSPAQLDFYLEELRFQLEEEFNLRCPENSVQVAPIRFAGQSYTNTSQPVLRNGRRLSDGTNQVDQYVEASYRAPPPKPNFSQLSTNAIDSGGSVPSRRKLQQKYKHYPSIYQTYPRYNGRRFEDGVLIQNITTTSEININPTNLRRPTRMRIKPREKVVPQNTNHTFGIQPKEEVALQRTNHVFGEGTCQTDSDFLTRLQRSQEAYFEEIEGISALVIEGSFSFSFNYGFDASGLRDETWRNRKLWWH